MLLTLTGLQLQQAQVVQDIIKKIAAGKAKEHFNITIDFTDLYMHKSNFWFWRNKTVSASNFKNIELNLQRILSAIPEASIQRLRVCFPPAPLVVDPMLQRANTLLGAFVSMVCILMGERLKGLVGFLVYAILGSHTHTAIRCSSEIQKGYMAIQAGIAAHAQKFIFEVVEAVSDPDGLMLVVGFKPPVRFGKNQELVFSLADHSEEAHKNSLITFGVKT